MNNKTRTLVGLVMTVALLAGCSASTGASASPSLSPVATLTPVSPSPDTSASPAPPDGEISTPDEAAQRVIEEYPEFAGLQPENPDMIGSCCWYEATEVEGGYQVVVTVGWGDCPSGCIERHNWTFAVSPAGDVGLIKEDGPRVPPGTFGG